MRKSNFFSKKQTNKQKNKSKKECRLLKPFFKALFE